MIEKGWQAVRQALSVSWVISGTKVYQSHVTATSAPPRQLSAYSIHCFALHLLWQALVETEMVRYTDWHVINSIGNAITTQQIDGSLAVWSISHQKAVIIGLALLK